MKRAVQIVIACAIGGVCLWFSFRDTDWAAVWKSIRGIHWGWMLAAQIPIYAAFFARVQRWSYIVRVEQPASFRHLFSATQIGFLINFSIGFRLGELVRPLALSRLTSISFSKALAFNAMDRVSDLVGLLAVLFISLGSVADVGDVVIPKETFGMQKDFHFSPAMIRTGTTGAIMFLLLVVGVLVMLYTNQRLTLRVSDAVLGVVSTKLADRVHAMLEQFADGLHAFRSPADMLKATGYSFAMWGLNILGAGMIFTAFDLDWPWYTPFVMQALLAVFIGAPTTPGMVGQFHLPIVISLVMLIPGIVPAEAKAVAIVIHAVNMFAVFVLGIYALMREGFNLFDVPAPKLEEIKVGD